MAEEKAADLKQLFMYEHDAGRLELFVRIVYGWIAIGIVLVVYGFVAEICLFIQWFVILILGRRSEGLSNFKGCPIIRYFANLDAYFPI